MRGITMDGIYYDLHVEPLSLKRAFSLLEGRNGGTALTGRKIRDILGTEYNFTLQFEPNKNAPEDYDRFYEAISAPVNSHVVELPYGQGTIEFEAGVVSGSDELLIDGPIKYWGRLSVEFTPIKPQRY